jgi:hypothetical protein
VKRVDILKKAKALIEPSGKWCRGAYARDRHGCSVPSHSGIAVKWCALGALGAVAGDYPKMVCVESLLVLVADKLYGLSLTETNDKRGKAAVLRCYDAAIRRAAREDKRHARAAR